MELYKDYFNEILDGKFFELFKMSGSNGFGADCDGINREYVYSGFVRHFEMVKVGKVDIDRVVECLSKLADGKQVKASDYIF